MPRRDGTGPAGDGRPGRGLGPCGNDKMSDNTSRVNAGRGMNRGNGGNRGSRGQSGNRGSGQNKKP